MRNYITKQRVKSHATEMLGLVLMSIGIYNFAVNAAFPLAGFTGVSVIINRLTAFPIGLTMVLLNIPVALVCYHLLGRRFFFRSLRSMLVLSLLLDYFAPLFPVYEGPRLLAAVACGVIAGTGFSLVITQHSSTGSVDFIVMAIKAKRPHMPLRKIILFCDLIPIVTGGLIFQDVDGIFYGLIVSFFSASVSDRVIYGTNSGKVLLIVTSDAEKIRNTIEEAAHRGCTIWDANGGYAGEQRKVVMCACDNAQMYKVQRAVSHADGQAFTIILDSSQVAGQGFRRLVLGEKID